MPPLPTLSGGDVVKAFANAGWQMVRQRGSHIIMVKERPYGDTLRPGYVALRIGRRQGLRCV
jgi:predicted RNA binding protein YcfA (HicA-like mRNA interferase family)